MLQGLFDAVPDGDATVRGVQPSCISPAANLGEAQDEGPRNGQRLRQMKKARQAVHLKMQWQQACWHHITPDSIRDSDCDGLHVRDIDGTKGCDHDSDRDTDRHMSNVGETQVTVADISCGVSDASERHPIPLVEG